MYASEAIEPPATNTQKNNSSGNWTTEILQQANQLGIGPMGLGGKTSLLGVKIGCLNRHPASFFVTVSYMCWAYRRQGARFHPNGQIEEWLY